MTSTWRAAEKSLAASARAAERHGASPGSVQQEPDGRVGQLFDIGLRQKPGLAVPHDLVDTRGADRDGGQPAGVRLGQHETLGLGLGREEEEVGRLVVRRQLFPGDRAGEADGFARGACGGEAPQRRSRGSPAPREEAAPPTRPGRSSRTRRSRAPRSSRDRGGRRRGRAARPRPGRAARLASPRSPGRNSSSGTPVGTTAIGAFTPRSARLSAIRAEGAITRSAEPAKREASLTAIRGDEGLRQRHVVGVLLVARVVREDERPALGAGQPPRGHAEEERMLGVEDVEIELQRQRGSSASRMAAAGRSPDRSARAPRGSGRRRRDRREARSTRARRPRPGGPAPRAPAAASLPRW